MRRSFYVLGVLVALAVAASGARGQNVNASLSGTITDSSGGVVAGATVTATNEGTQLSRTAVSDARGIYVLNVLPVGSYTLSVSLTGFKETVIHNIVLQVDQQARKDVTLQAGSLAQTVTVEGTAPIVQAESSSMGEVVNNQEVTELPLNGRNLDQLALISGGVVPANQSNVEAGSASTLQTFSVAGGRSNTNAFLIDGVANTDDAIDNSALHPSLEMVQEFRIETNDYSAQFGQYSGGQVNITTKSGTNQFHGSAFEFLRNDALDAKNFFVRPGQAKPPLRRNQFGGSLGGPIKRNKLFFFFSYEGLRYTDGQTGVGTVPTSAMLGGNFSELLQPNNPYTHTVTQLVDPQTGTPISGNILTSINPIGAAIAALYPAGEPGGLINNYTASPSLVQSDDEYNIRSDYALSPTDAIAGRFTYLRENVNQPYPLGPAISPLVGYGSIQPSTQDNAFVSETHTFSPTVINEFKVGFSRIVLSVANQNSANVAGQLGIIGLDPAAYASYSGVPTFSIPGFASISPVNFFPQIRADSTYQLTDNFSWVHGAHSFKFGFDLTRFQLYQDVNVNVRGSFTFSGQYSGFGLADLLLGYPSQTSKLQLPGPLWSYAINSSRSFYALDDWNVSNRLTLNLGLRYELDPPVFYKGGQQAGFNPLLGVIQVPVQTEASISPFLNTPPIPIPVPIQQVDRKTICDEDTTNFAPRVGFAYRPFSNDKTVVRGGFGIFYNMPYTNTSCGSSGMLWQYSESFVGALKGSTPNITLNNPFPQALLRSAFTPTANYPNQHTTPRVNQYNLDIERALTPTVLFEIGYMGSTGSDLPIALNINQAVQGTGSVNSRRPYAALGLLNTITWNGYEATSSYNALLLHLEKRTSHGATFLVNYTYGHALDTGTGSMQNVYDIAASRGSSTSDIRHRFVASYVYQLPFGRGRSMGSNWNRVVDGLLGGWQTGGIFTYQTGFPLTSTIFGLDNSQTGGLNDRPNVSGSTSLANRGIAKWFNTAAFSLAPTGQFGDEETGAIVGPGLVDLDFSLVKNFRIYEQHNLEFRAELFNAFNHPNFLNPVTTFNSPAFGTITGAEAGREIQFGLRYSF
ncbi:MAG TPA: carboxypeptidase-like regulatory domain-containing protein [Candidatus Dormibacteraeota bacterium]|nr:carboxypeptidase-like regulatory domain-containing protein [Candidatus Dormibacteraeota bacterium]